MKRTRNKKESPSQMQVVGYVRVSSHEQAAEGVSLEGQREKIAQWAALNNATILGIFEDAGISGKKTDREGLNAAMELTIKQGAVLVVYSLSRFSRSAEDCLAMVRKLLKANSNLVSITENIDTISATGKMIFSVLSVLNEFEANIGGERTKAALTTLKAKGRKTGGIVPYGYDTTPNEDGKKKLIPNDAEQRVIKTIFRQQNEGKNYSVIARNLNKKGIPTKTGKPWYAQTIKNVLNYVPPKNRTL